MKTHPLTIVVATGNAHSIECAVRASGKVPAQEFLDSLADLREGKSDGVNAKARFMVLFQQMANYGHVSPKRFKTEMDGLFAFKHEVRNVQIRFPCFRDGKRWILTHGFFKPGAKKGLGDWPQSEVDRALEIMSEYHSRKGGSK